jgi:hypothetical protein
VSGAGTAAVNGCYKPVAKGLCGGGKGFALDALHELYEWQGVWRLGKCGGPHAYKYYFAARKSALPPESAGATRRDPGGCGDGGGWTVDTHDASGPCPAVNRTNMLPAPTPPPPAPAPQPPAPAPPAPPMRLVFSDDFNGAEVNATRWNVINASHAYCPANVFTENGSLVLRVSKNNLTHNGSTEHYACGGAVNTARRFYQNQGRWEASVKLPRVADGRSYTLHSSIWLTARGDDATSGPVTPPNISDCAQEIDVVEQYGEEYSLSPSIVDHRSSQPFSSDWIPAARSDSGSPACLLPPCPPLQL